MLGNGSPCSCAATALLPASLAIRVGACGGISRITSNGVYPAPFNRCGKMTSAKRALGQRAIKCQALLLLYMWYMFCTGVVQSAPITI